MRDRFLYTIILKLHSEDMKTRFLWKSVELEVSLRLKNISEAELTVARAWHIVFAFQIQCVYYGGNV